MQKINFTMVPNEIIDEHLKDLTGAELKILLAITRKTIGWHKDTDWISNQQMMEITGLSRPTVTETVNKLINKGLVIKTKDGHLGQERIWYTLNLEEEGKKATRGGQESYGEGVNKLPHKINTTKETTQKKKDLVSKQILEFFNKTTNKNLRTINKYI